MTDLSHLIDSEWLTSFRRRMRSWFKKHGRTLPWRATADPYQIWISEIMLQQTTVTAVIPYFDRFMNQFPSVEKLSKAKEEQVLRMWEGLGYYSRARNIHKAAKYIMNDCDGIFPDSVETLQELPGVGRYTAGAIASFAYALPAPIVEANTLRLYTRLLGMEDDPRSKLGQEALWQFAEMFLTKKNPGELNQSVMELGSLICTPKNPNCKTCPVVQNCHAFSLNIQNEIPVPVKKPVITPVTDATVAIHKKGKYLLRRYQPGERWAGLWDFPRYSLDGGWENAKPISPQKKSSASTKLVGKKYTQGQCQKILETEISLGPQMQIRINTKETDFKHSVTRYRIHLHCFSAEWEKGEIVQDSENWNWVSFDELDEYPLTTTGRKFANVLIGK